MRFHTDPFLSWNLPLRFHGRGGSSRNFVKIGHWGVNIGHGGLRMGHWDVKNGHWDVKIGHWGIIGHRGFKIGQDTEM